MNKLVAIVGMSGSGKSVASTYLEKKGFNKIYFGGVVLDELEKNNLEINPVNEKMMREKLRKEHGMAVMAKLLLPKIKKSLEEKDTVLDGLYSWDEYLVLKKEFPSLKLIAIVVDKELRYERVSKRGERGQERSVTENRDISEIENLAKGGPISMADYYIFNNRTINTYHKRLEQIILDIEERGV